MATMMAERVMNVSQYQKEEEEEEEEEENETKEEESKQQEQAPTLLDDDETPAAVLARYAAAGPADEEADDALLVAEKIRLLQEENVRLRQTLGAPGGSRTRSLRPVLRTGRKRIMCVLFPILRMNLASSKLLPLSHIRMIPTRREDGRRQGRRPGGAQACRSAQGGGEPRPRRGLARRRGQGF